ncbi:MAG: shikimate kinase [Oscillospiraceae bacterium]|nr:shikimate kinase [Oscillospiraceae bacterium]
MNKILHIFGASCSGTSSLARSLSEKTGFRHFDSDDYLWLPTDPPFTDKRNVEERLLLLQRDLLASDCAVLSGSIVGWGDPLIPMFSLAVRLTVPTKIRLDRHRRREYARFGDRILPGGDMYEQHQAFLQWAAAYDEGGSEMRSRLQHDLWQKQLRCRLLTLDGTRPLDELTDEVLEVLSL